MEGAIVLIALIPIALLILAIITASRTGNIGRQVEELRKEVGVLRKALADRVTVPPHAATGQPPPQAPPIPATPPVKAPGEPWYSGMREGDEAATLVQPTPAPPIVAETPAPPPAQPPPRIVVTEHIPTSEQTQRATAAAPRIVLEPARPTPPRTPPPPPQKGAWERFLDNNPDLEKFIGENLINKIGIAVLVLGLGFLLRYAIGKNYINEVGRILIGIAAGGALMFIAHRLRKKLRAFSSVLVAGGISVLYFTIAIAFRQYGMFPQTAAFAIMVVITALAVVFAIAYDRRELAVIALIGGFAAPFMVSTGAGNFKVLFSYLLILNAGMLVLALLKRWNVVHLVAYGLTLLVFGAWAMDAYTDMMPRPWKWGFLFATGFHLVFFAMAVGYNLRYNLKFRPLEFGLLVGNTATYYGVGMHFLTDAPLFPDQKWTGLFTAVLGLFHMVFAFVFYKRKQVPRNLVLLLIGLALTFCTLAVPVQLEGYTITIFWAAEAVLLLWFSQRASLPMVMRGSVLVAMLAVASLIMDLDAFYSILRPELRPVINPGWITGMVVVLCMVGLWWLARRSQQTRSASPLPLSDGEGQSGRNEIVPGIAISTFGSAALFVAVALGYLVNLLELRNQSARFLSVDGVRMITMAFTIAYLLGLDFFTRRAGKQVRTVVFGLSVLALLAYVTTYYTSSIAEAIRFWSSRAGNPNWLHLVALLLCVGLLLRMALLARFAIARHTIGWKLYLWLMCGFLVLMASQELDHLLVWFVNDNQHPEWALHGIRRAGYPILWGIGSFLFMWYGMRTKLKTVRVVALVLFGITLVKLFVFDLKGISEGGKVAAFICLGILLLVVSFMYNKLKGLFVDEDKGNEAVKP